MNDLTLNAYQQYAMDVASHDLSLKDIFNLGGLGLSGEAGEVADLLKKHLYHGHDLNNNKLDKELGDVLWYIAYLANANGSSLSKIAQMNIDKLQKRYPLGFSKEASINRDSNDD